MTKCVVIYARLSVSQETSVSIERQIEACHQYAAAQGWTVVGEPFLDDGVSASKNKPEDRNGWRALMRSPEPYDAVVVWKIDRLARRITDFWATYNTLNESGRSLVSVTDNLDLGTALGRTVVGVLAGFAEMEAEAISARVTGARHFLLRNGRVPGGALPYGWRSIPNPEGKGHVLAQDPEKIDYVRGMVERAQRGDTIYSVKQWLDQIAAPLPSGSQTNRKSTEWRYSTVERILRNPILAGMTAFNPGNDSKVRGTDVLRDADGLPVVDESIAIMSIADWRKMIAALDNRDSPQAKPRAVNSKTSALLSGLVRCGYCLDENEDSQRMYRGTISSRPGFYCKGCGQAVSNLDPYVIEQFLWAKGDHTRWSLDEEVHEGGAAMLPEIEHRLSELMAALQATDDDTEADRLAEQIGSLRAMRREARATAPNVITRPIRTENTYGEDWTAADGVEDQRAVLDDALDAVWIVRGRAGGHGLDTNRVIFGWKFPSDLGPFVPPADDDLTPLDRGIAS